MVSLFGYPGAGHFVVGSPRWGAFYALTFTLTTLAGISEVWYLIPELWKMYQGYATTISRMPNFGRLGLWIVLTAALWVASAVHSGILANQSNARSLKNLDQSIDGQKYGEQDVTNDQAEHS